LADWARVYRPDQLAGMARDWIEQLDQDGPSPMMLMSWSTSCTWPSPAPVAAAGSKASWDASTFDVLARAIAASVKPRRDENKSLGQRQADALGEICEHALDDGYLPAEGGERPHITTIIPWEWMQDQARGATWNSAADQRRGAAPVDVRGEDHPVVLGGDSQPLDVGRERRCVTLAQRKAVAARDRGCAYPGVIGHPGGARCIT